MKRPLPQRIQRRNTAPVLLGLVVLLIGGCTVDTPEHPSTQSGDEAVQLIDGMRDKGSLEKARDRLNATARTIADRISAAIPGQTWRFDDDPHGLKTAREGGPCERLTADIARRPISDPVIFGRTFTAEEFGIAAEIVREEAAPYGATGDSSLFDDPSRRDFRAEGSGYEFTLGQINFATLTITGDCFLTQRALDSPPGRLPPEPPIVPTAPTPTP